MFKNYMLINALLALILLIMVALIIRGFTRPVQDLLEMPTIQEGTPAPLTDPESLEQPTARDLSEQNFALIHEQNLFHPERIVPPTATPVTTNKDETPTPEPVDCSNSQITLSGIVRIENDKPFCFLKHPQDTGNEVAIFYLEQDIGGMKITAIDDDYITLTASDGKTCDLVLFDFSETAQKPEPRPGDQRARPTPRNQPQRPTPVRPRPTPRRHGVSR
ncbi:hypothetical protein JXQ70_18805 [bacterium]|nr:hypothetical protein [bacterium]